ncbi:hypothetical protein MMC12_007990 [Toensbergia leucococca]|nr:hypothetical protein [Toensbergia leucococca]
MSCHDLYTSLLRPPILHILRAAGFHATRPAVLDTLVDLAARYLALLASTAASHASINHNDLTPTITDVRMALYDVGALRPQISIMEEQSRGEEDLRGVEAFIEWVMGEGNKEIRRIAGLAAMEGEAAEVEALVDREDFLTALKKKHSKTGEESRYQGTVLGKLAEERPVRIEGGQVESIQAWEARLREQGRIQISPSIRKHSSVVMSSESSPLSEI